MLSLCSKEIALNVKEGVRLRVVLKSGLKHSDSLDFFVCTNRKW